MKRISIALAAVLFLAMASCQKEEITPSKPDLKEKLKQCRTCEGHWDLADSTKRG